MSVSEESSPGTIRQQPRTSPDASGSASRSASGARARSRDATRARLIESGRMLFAKKGLHGVTAHDIAHGAEVASGTFYLHFKNKRELFREIVRGCVDELLSHIELHAPELDEDPKFVAAQCEALVCFAEANREVIRMLFSADTDAAAVESDVLKQLADVIAEGRRRFIQAGKASGEVDPLILGHAVVGMWAQVLSWWSEDPTRASRETLIKTLTQIALTGTHPI